MRSKDLTHQQKVERLKRREERSRANLLPPTKPFEPTRKLARSIARVAMEKKGATRINKKRGENVLSFFAANWRKYV